MSAPHPGTGPSPARAGPGAGRHPPRTTARALLPLAFVALAACGDASRPGLEPCEGKSRAPGIHEVRLESGGRERRFLLVIPEAAAAGKPLALVLAFHGVLSTPEAFVEVTGLGKAAAARGFVLAAGAGVERSWNAGACCDPAAALGVDDVGFARDVVAAVEEELCIDPARIFATGFSNGAAMVFRLACEADDLFAATAPVAGGIGVACDPARARSILIVNNVDDPIVPFVLGEVAFDQLAAQSSCGPDREIHDPASNARCTTAVCRDETTTTLCAVFGLSHVWPGGALDPNGAFRATDVIADFFAAQAGGDPSLQSH